MEIRGQIEQKIRQTLVGLGIDSGTISLEHPAELAHGDYATGIALKFAKQAGKNPRELAEAIVAHLGGIDGVAKIEVAGPGFINFTLAPESIIATLERARHDEQWGTNESLTGKTIMVEFTDPNPFKQFHIGHLMSNAIGESITRLLEASGAKVLRANYQGDVGPHVAKALYILLERNVTEPTIQDISSAYVEGAHRYESDGQSKVAIDALNKQIYERSDEHINELYAKGRAVSLAHFEDLYHILGTKFDFYFFESDTGPIGRAIVEAHIEDGIFEKSEGAVIFLGEKYGLHTRVFITSAGNPTYETKDIGNAREKADTVSFDRSIVVTASEQSEYFKVMHKAMELLMPDVAEKTSHVTHGMMRFTEGKMSSRKGNVVTGESLLTELAEVAKTRAAESRAKDHDVLAQQIAVAAIKYQVLKQTTGKDIVFDRDRALSLEGDSGPYLQYTYARTHAILDRAHVANVKPVLNTSTPQSDLMRLITRFPEVVLRAANEYEPHYVAIYLIEIASAFNSWYGQVQILDQSKDEPHKVAIVEAVSHTLKNGLRLLGIPTPDRM
ncbi:MAG TPA: arginine--tRNA ligase [Candidatus Paceibacterota bacterium]|nr:arginine--tRNA ligase [Candidatus Paceibacterota bacterium]